MPLEHSSSKGAFKRNVSTLMKDVGKSPHVQSKEQALAVAYATQRRGKATGGQVSGLAASSSHMTGKGVSLGLPHMTKGPILSKVPGRTDAHQTHVPSGSYVIPADIVSGRGQGNTIAGSEALQKLFKMGPHQTSLMKVKRAKGGGVTETPVRVNLAGGEIVVPPEHLQETVHQDLKRAHDIMDRWVLNERKKLRKTLARLPGPVKED